MSIRNRTVTVITGAAVATALAGAAGFAAVDTSPTSAAVPGIPTHVTDLDTTTLAKS